MLMTYEDIVTRIKISVPGLVGTRIGDRWEGHTDNQLRVDVCRRKGRQGYSVLWEYHDGVHKHQFGKNSVTRAVLDEIIEQIVGATTVSIPSRFVESIEDETAAARDPALMEAAKIQEGTFQQEQQTLADDARYLQEQQKQLDQEMREAARLASEQAAYAASAEVTVPQDEAEPQIEAFPGVYGEDTLPDYPSNEAPPEPEAPNEQLDQDVEEPADQGLRPGLDGGGVVPQ